MQKTDQEQENNEASSRFSVLSMGFSLILVGVVIVFVITFRFFLSGNFFTSKTGEKTEQQNNTRKEYLDTEKNFEPCYIMIRNVSSKGFYASEIPGEKTSQSQKLKNGQIFWADQKGTYEGKKYYRLKNGRYIKCVSEKVERLRSYEKLGGYVVITYISTSGVRLRSWADFHADNIVKSVYVGDKVSVTGKVVTIRGDSAYITQDGLYLTTSTQYLNDYTTEEEAAEEDTQEQEVSY